MSQTAQPVDKKLVQLFDLSVDALCIAGFDGYLKFANPAFARLLGYTQEELLARPFMENVYPADVESVRAALGDLAAGDNIAGFQCRQVCADGSVRWFEWNTSTRPGEGFVYGVARDVTRRRAETEQLGALGRMATLVAEGAPPVTVFHSLAEEVKGLLGARTSAIARLDADGAVRIVANSGPETLPMGTRIDWPGSVFAAALRTGRPARKDDYKDVTTGMPGIIRSLGLRSSVAAPIIVEGALWGAIGVGSARDRFPDGTESRLEEFTRLAAAAVANAQSREAIGRLADEQAALRRVATLVAQGAAPADVFAAVSVEVDRVFHFDPAEFDLAGVVRFEPGPEFLVVGVSKSVEAVPLGSRFPPDELFAPTHVLRSGRSARVRADELETAGTEVAHFLLHHGYLSQVASPIVVDSRLWGAVSVNSGSELPVDTEERLERFTGLVATAIANAESREELSKLADEQAALRRVAMVVAQEPSHEQVFSTIAKEVGELLGLELVRVVRYEHDGTAVVVAGSGRVEDLFRVGSRTPPEADGAASRVFRTGEPVRFDDYETASAAMTQKVRSAGIGSVVATPIWVEGRLWGAMNAGTTQDEPLPPDTEASLGQFTELMATAIANAESRDMLARLADEQAALRHVATLVARDAPPGEVFDVVALEVGKLLDTDITVVGRYDGDGAATAIGSWSALPGGVPVGTRSVLGGRNVLTIVAKTEKPARVDGYDDAWGEAAEIARHHGWSSSIAAPVIVEGRLWGVMLVATQGPEPFPGGAEERLSAFTDLVATAIANTESKFELAASRRRIVAGADEARRRIERDLHDGIQQRLIALTLRARAMMQEPAAGLPAIAAELSEGLKDVSDELREISRGIHPTILTEAGLGPALRALARRSNVPVDVDVRLDERLPAPVEAAAYYVASEALTNVAKHAQANVVELIAACENAVLTLEVRDDGIGGVDGGRGSGILGLTDRVEALGGTISIASPPQGGTTLVIRLPVSA